MPDCKCEPLITWRQIAPPMTIWEFISLAVLTFLISLLLKRKGWW
jgi:hypothetical protein